ncbi:hypothetical protein EAI_00793, partial [Harpegnathos saltator]
QPPNSPDLAPCDFFLSVDSKNRSGERVKSNQEEIMEKSKTALVAIPKTEYQKCFEDWIKRWHKCVTVDGEDFGG